MSIVLPDPEPYVRRLSAYAGPDSPAENWMWWTGSKWSPNEDEAKRLSEDEAISLRDGLHHACNRREILVYTKIHRSRL